MDSENSFNNNENSELYNSNAKSKKLIKDKKTKRITKHWTAEEDE